MPKFAANLDYLFTELPFLDRFEAAARSGFKAVEILRPYVVPAAEIAVRLKANGLTLALLNVSAGNAEAGERGLAALAGREADFEAALRTALDYAAATACTRVHLVAGLVHQGARRETYVRNVKVAARAAAKAGVDVMLEPINRRDIPGFFLNTTQEARAIIHEVGELNVGLQLDLYHRQIEEGDVATAIGEFAALTRHYQIASPPDRGEPDDGEMNYRYLFRLIDETGFDGYVGCEYRPRRGTVEGLKWAQALGVKLG